MPTSTRAALRLLLAAATLAGAACTNSTTNPSIVANVPYSQTDLRLGTGAEVTSTSTISVNYTGWLYNAFLPDHKGTIFETNQLQGPVTVTLGQNTILPGIERGLVGMREGGLRRLVIPPALGFGSSGSGDGVIPPNSTVIFEFEVVTVQ